jgi:hypothetical protein
MAASIGHMRSFRDIRHTTFDRRRFTFFLAGELRAYCQAEGHRLAPVDAEIAVTQQPSARLEDSIGLSGMGVPGV